MRPANPDEALDAHHFAERFGLFVIILLGEVVVSAGQASADGHVATTGGWAALVAAMMLAGCLWWLYFDSVAEINLRVLELSGGSPTIARGIFAVGHMVPAFALLITAAGVGLLLEGSRRTSPTRCPRRARDVPGGTRVRWSPRPAVPAVRVLLVVATFFLGRLAATVAARVPVADRQWTFAAAVIASIGTRRADLEGYGFQPPK